MWYNGGPVAGDSARVLPIGSICKIFVQSSTPLYADRFSRKFDILSQIYFVPSIQSFFHFHLAYSPLHFHVANKFLVAHSEPPALPIGPSFISKQERKNRNKRKMSRLQLQRRFSRHNDLLTGSPQDNNLLITVINLAFFFYFLLILYKKYVIILKKDTKTDRFQIKRIFLLVL